MMLVLGLALLCTVPSYINANCGVRPAGTRVVSGQNAAPHAWPWQISLRNNGRHICGGSLITPEWVVTAAHCVDRDPRPSAYTVAVGVHRQSGMTNVQRTFRVSQLFKHSGFSMRHFRNDITLLRLSSPVQLSSQVNTVCLPQAGSRAPAGSRCYITGWGRTIGGGRGADTLQQAVLTVAQDQACVKRNSYLVPVDPRSMICAGGQRAAGGCQGDSGGPFVCNEGGKWVLRGAVSWGHPNCRTDHYTVFARVSALRQWIDQVMQGGGGAGGGGGGSVCQDRDQRCQWWGHLCRYEPFVRANCARTCRLC